MTGLSELQSWQRPPFEPGNEVATTHGVYSPRKVEPLAQELVELVLADPDTAYLAAPRWRPALWAWARAESQAQLLTEYLAIEGELSYDGVGDLDLDRIRSAYLLLHRAETRGQSGRTRLGLDPLSASRLGLERAAAGADVARMMTELRAYDERQRAAAGASVVVDEVVDERGR